MSNPAKKFKIRPISRPLYRDHASSLNLIKNAIDVIHAKNASTLSFEEIYRSAYYLVLDSNGSTLYQTVLTSFSTILNAEVSDIAKFIPFENDGEEILTTFLKMIIQRWEHFRVFLKMTSDVLMYMDKMYCSQSHKPLTWDAGLQLFRNNFIRSSLAPIRPAMRSSLLKLIEGERNGSLIDTSLIKKILDMLQALGDSLADLIDARPPSLVHGEVLEKGSVYDVDFESSFLENTRAYYTTEAEAQLKLPISEYLKNCEKRLNEESERASRYLGSSTLKPLISITERTLIQEPLPKLIELGAFLMFQTNALDDLARFYRLVKKVTEGSEQLSVAASNYFLSHTARILEILTSAHESQDEVGTYLKWVEEILKLHDQLRSFLASSFQFDPSFEKIMQNAVSEIINKNSILASEAIAVCLDQYLRKNMKINEEEIETQLNRTLILFSYLRDKDAFGTYFHQLQSKRLLSKLSNSGDHEKLVLAHLRTLCGSQFTCKFEKKLVDMATSNDLSVQFQQSQSCPFDFHVDVLTSSLWPTSVQFERAKTCIYPSRLRDVMLSFETFYSGLHSNRILTWQPQWGSGEVRGYFKQVHDLTLPTFGVIILLQFNEKEQYTMEELHANTMIPEEELSRYLLSLSLGKFKVLNKQPATKVVQPLDTFSVNSEFKEKRMKLRIPLIVMNKSEKQQKATTLAQLEEERSSVVDAVLVRIMKSRKRMPHSELLAEVIKQLTSRFLPQPQLIKRRIENLIDRDFLERAPEDTTIYVYVA